MTKTKEQKAQSAQNESRLNQKIYQLNNPRTTNNGEQKRDLDMETEEEAKETTQKLKYDQRKSQIDTNQLKKMFGGIATNPKTAKNNDDDLEPNN